MVQPVSGTVVDDSAFMSALDQLRAMVQAGMPADEPEVAPQHAAVSIPTLGPAPQMPESFRNRLAVSDLPPPATMANTLTGHENYEPPMPTPSGDSVLWSLARGITDPLNLIPQPPPVTVSRSVPSLTGNEDLRSLQTSRLPEVDPNSRAAASLSVAGPVGRGIGSIVEQAGSLAARFPNATAGMATAAGLTALSGQATPPAEAQSAADIRASRIGELERAIGTREKTLQSYGNRQFPSRVAREAANKVELDAIDAARTEIARLRGTSEAEAAEVARAAQDAERAVRWRNTPWAEAYPWFPWATFAGGALAGGLAANALSRAGVRNYNTQMADLGTRWQGSVERAGSARTQAAREQAIAEAQDFGRQVNALESAGAGLQKPALWSAMAGTELGMATPMISDYLSSAPGSPLRDHVRNSMDLTSAEPWSRYLFGGLSGLAMGKYLTNLAQRNIAPTPNFSPETNALAGRYLATGTTPQLPLPAAGQPPAPQHLAPAAVPPPLQLPAPTAPPASSSSTRTSVSPSAPRDSSTFPRLPEGYSAEPHGRGYRVRGPDGRFTTRPASDDGRSIYNPDDPSRLTRGQ